MLACQSILLFDIVCEMSMFRPIVLFGWYLLRAQLASAFEAPNFKAASVGLPGPHVDGGAANRRSFLHLGAKLLVTALQR